MSERVAGGPPTPLGHQPHTPPPQQPEEEPRMVTHYVSDYDGTRNKDGDKVAPTEVDAKVVEDSTVEDKAVRKAATTAKTAKKKN